MAYTAAEIAMLESEVESLRGYLMEMNSSHFSVQEIQKLINPPATFGVRRQSEYKNWLLVVKKRVDAGIRGGRHGRHEPIKAL